MDAGIYSVIYMELHSGPKMANGTCGKTIVVGTIDQGSTVPGYSWCIMETLVGMHVPLSSALLETFFAPICV